MCLSRTRRFCAPEGILGRRTGLLYDDQGGRRGPSSGSLGGAKCGHQMGPNEISEITNGLLLVANLLGAAVGCGALKLHIDTQIAEVKRMWVASDVRGLGLGRRLLERLSAEAASRGMVILRLETNRSLSEAKHLYERAGFVEVERLNNEPYAHHWFQKDLRHK